jgi:hypothetical protein
MVDLSSICNQIYNRISEKDYGIDYNEEEGGLWELWKKHKITSSIGLFKFSKYVNENEIGRAGDLLVGFYAENDCKFDLVINNEHICSFDMKAGEFSYAIQGKYVLPISKIVYHTVKLENTNYYPLLVYAHILDTDLRRTTIINNYKFPLLNHSLECDMVNDNEKTETYVIAQGMCYNIAVLKLKEEILIQLPNMLDYGGSQPFSLS